MIKNKKIKGKLLNKKGKLLLKKMLILIQSLNQMNKKKKKQIP